MSIAVVGGVVDRVDRQLNEDGGFRTQCQNANELPVFPAVTSTE